jgi:hypothetical protein
MNPRSILRVRPAPHIHPDRRDEVIVEVLRDGQVVASIYGSREGIHIASERLGPETRNTPFRLELPSSPEVKMEQGFIVPLLATDEPCPWCEMGLLGVIRAIPCPVCNPDVMRVTL